jgi:ribose transport system permease protein
MSDSDRGLYVRFLDFFNKHIRIMAPILTLVVLTIFFSFVGVRFATVQNMTNILRNSALLIILGCGITMILLIAEIDLSFANMMTLISVLTSYLLVNQQWPSSLNLPSMLILGILFGLLNGACVAYITIPSFAVTLASMTIFNGASEWLTEGRPFFKVPEILYYLGNESIENIPILVAIAFGIALIFYFVLKYTRFGRYVYMVGGNSEAARLAGVNVKLIRLEVFAIMGLTVAVAGMLGLGRLGSTQTGTFESLLIAGLAATVIGGTSLFGGEGGIGHTIVGVFIWYVLRNGLDLMDISIYLKTMVIGIILLLALIFNLYLQRRSAQIK